MNPKRVTIYLQSDETFHGWNEDSTGHWIYDPDKIIDVNKFQTVKHLGKPLNSIERLRDKTEG